jgi:hypothetical protein
MAVCMMRPPVPTVLVAASGWVATRPLERSRTSVGVPLARTGALA